MVAIHPRPEERDHFVMTDKQALLSPLALVILIGSLFQLLVIVFFIVNINKNYYSFQEFLPESLLLGSGTFGIISVLIYGTAKSKDKKKRAKLIAYFAVLIGGMAGILFFNYYKNEPSIGWEFPLFSIFIGLGLIFLGILNMDT